MSLLNVTYFGATDIGKVRTNNEDTFIAQSIWDDRHILLVVIDGMGGEEGGEVAADIARSSILRYLEEFQNDTILNLIKRAVADANNEIIRNKEAQPQYRRMGCVATAGIIDLDEKTLSIAHVGDSRLYRYSHGELIKLTHDHSLVGYQEEQGILTEEQAMKHPRRSVIERCLGSDTHLADDASFIEAAVFPLFDEETYLFCSDGLCDVLTSFEIENSLSPKLSPESECGKLIANANKAGGKDNITVVIAHISESKDMNAAEQKSEYDAKENTEVPNEKSVNKPKFKRLIITSLIVILYSVFLITLGFWIGIKYEPLQHNTEINRTPKASATNDAALQENITLPDSITLSNDTIMTNE